MFSKPARFGLLIVGLLVTAAVTYRAVDDESSLGRAYRDADTHARAATQALEALLDLRGSLHAYVAPGQGVPFWSRRVQDSLDVLRERLATLDAGMTPLGQSMGDALDATDQLAAAEKRIGDHARRGEALLAGDILFVEARDLLAGLGEQIHQASNTLDAAHGARISSLRGEQAMLAAAGMVMWLLIALAFFAQPVAVPEKKPEQWRQELATAIKKPIPKEPGPPAPAPVPAPVIQIVSMGPTVPIKAVSEAGEVCSDLSTLSDVGALSGALARAAAVLDAGGMIVWLASNDGGSLTPVASHGFDPKLVSRIGRIPRDSSNLTAAAYRENISRVSEATPDAPAAMAVALCGPTGTVGVLSVELKPNIPADEGRVALATIFAAQLATLAVPLPSEPAVPVKTAAL
jgi:hypothetical protein